MPETGAALIRRAAETMRKQAEAARTSASGRWYVRTPEGSYPQGISDNASAILVADCHQGPQRPPTAAPFIASWDPVTALAVATWLDATADRVFGLAEMLGVYSEPANDPVWNAALDVARTFLREHTD